MPIRLVNEVLFQLVGAGILSEARSGDAEEVSYQVARPLDRLTVGYVIGALARRGMNSFPVPESPEIARLSAGLDEMARDAERSPGNIALKDI